MDGLVKKDDVLRYLWSYAELRKDIQHLPEVELEDGVYRYKQLFGYIVDGGECYVGCRACRKQFPPKTVPFKVCPSCGAKEYGYGED